MNIEIPKVELHVHLDGSVRLETLSELSGLTLEDTFHQAVVPKNCESLSDYLTCFDLPIQVMQTRENLVRIAQELGEDLKRENVIYAEVRFNPLAHTKEGLTKEEVVDAVLEGFAKVDIPINLILCMMRSASLEENSEVIMLARQYWNQGVVALDLAGDESKYPTSDFATLFEIVRNVGIPFTIHAGESASFESVKSAIQMGARRIGHGIHAIEDEETLQLLKDKNILLEMCPTSNIHTKAVNTIKEHPFWQCYQMHIPISINTDNRTVSFTNLSKEYQTLAQTFPVTFKDFCAMNTQAIAASFLEDEQKVKLQRTIDNYLKQFSE